MTALTHVIIGGTVGTIAGFITKNPAVALAAGIASHLICDSIPHLDYPPSAKFIGKDIVWDKNVFIFAFIDSFAAFFITLAYWGSIDNFNFSSMFAWGAFGAYLPDLLDNVPWWRFKMRTLPFFKQFHKLHEAVHDNWTAHFPLPKHWKLGIATQVVAVSLCAWYFLS